MNITIRPGVPADAAKLAELAARTFQDTFAAGTNPDDMARHLAQAYGPLQQGRELEDPNVITLLVPVGDELAAYAQLRRQPAPACVTGDAPFELWRFYVAKEWHGRGIAQQLMRRVDEEAHRAGARTLWLGVWEHNERAKAFYRKCNFVDVGAHVFMVGGDAQTDRILVRPVMKTPTLYIFSGLPGSGKTTLSQLLARRVGAAHLRIDTIEQALRELCSVDIEDKGYRLAYRLADDNLRLGISVVADSCNPIELTRRAWERVATDAGAHFVNIEVVCSDIEEHCRRVEARVSTVPGLRLPTWQEVIDREYEPWTADRVVVETAGRSEQECLDELLSVIRSAGIVNENPNDQRPPR